MSTNNSDQTIPVVWALKPRHTVNVTRSKDGRFRVIIRWSEKLGLEHRGSSEDFDSAERFAQRVRDTGHVTLEHWTKQFGRLYLWDLPYTPQRDLFAA